MYSIDIAGNEVQFMSLSMGNPHAIIELNDENQLSADSYLEQIAQFLQSSPLFPDSVNVNFIYKVTPQILKMRTYERGCGFTLACGSGACASAASAIKAGLTDTQVKLIMPGGELNVSWSGGDLYMIGSATMVFVGELEI